MVAVLTSIPAVSPLNPAVLWVGVIFVLAVSIVKEGKNEDIKPTKTILDTKSTRRLIMKNQSRFFEEMNWFLFLGDSLWLVIFA